MCLQADVGTVENAKKSGKRSSMRVESCLTCDREFVVRPMHPMIEAAHCDACLAILRPLWWDMVHAEMQPPGETMLAMTAEEV